MRRCERLLLELQRKVRAPPPEGYLPTSPYISPHLHLPKVRAPHPEGGAAAFDAHLHAIKEAGQGKAQAAVLAYRLLLDGPRLQPLLLRFCGLAGAGLERLARGVSSVSSHPLL